MATPTRESTVDARGATGAVGKALVVLDALADHSRVTDLAKAAGLPKSTVHRVLQTLVDQGFALADNRGNYLVGPRVLALAGKVLQRFDPARRAGLPLRQLHRDTGGAVHFAMLFGDELVYVDKVEGDRPSRLPTRIGMSLPLHSTSIGKAVLAALPADELAARLRQLRLVRRTPRTATDPRQVLWHIERARSAGYALDDEETEPGVRCVGATVRDHTGRVVGGISVATLTRDLDLTRLRGLGPRVIAAATQVSAALGYPG
jgi:IclR family transcriptional regulator, KDG regulon repressor